MFAKGRIITTKLERGQIRCAMSGKGEPNVQR
jgi:hypothetical protein